MKNNNLKGGLFDMRGKPQPLALKKSREKIIIPEKHIQSSFIAWRDLFKRDFPILKAIFAVPNGLWTKNKAVAKNAVREGLTAGIQDVICLAPSADGKYSALLIEFKTEADSSKQSDEQIFFHEFFASLGYRTEVCRSAYAASVLVNEHLGIKVPIYPR